ncbi:adenine specific DNA methylase Mod [Azospira oryzae PS]|uniref:site-specific DNA-methyltransferase (adenine-specific) n=1 Tax=Azospira oryzae (strain ATCC BAA-33 / DSM 13638 / PS) TaxID=640081 RepID=G8QK05_AZOOP|nr:site-specific DNA-methyltransferase [Azospira oryzae]AEV27684.1 adenine specific DNA methylase Mod [Azospira oryzae PS]
MPTLHWVGKNKVVNHHHEVPFRLLDKQYSFTANKGTPANSTNNKIIHGDNLEALKSLLPEFEGKVNCIYIDPPYNTGNEGWVYNDNVNDPKIKKWLGQVVGKEGEDLSRHDKWLCMMYPRLKLLHRLLADEGSMWISIDDAAVTLLRPVMDEIFGAGKLIASNVWQKRYSRENREAIGDVHEYILVYSKTPAAFKLSRNKIPIDEKQAKVYRNPNNDPKGRWRPIPMTAQAGHATADQFYEIISPSGKKFKPSEGRCWGISEATFKTLLSEGRIYFGKKGNSQPNIIRYLSEVEGVVPWTWWPHEEVGNTDEATKDLMAIFGGASGFDTTPKPVRLIERVLQICSQRNSLILDSFGGSGTTAHAVLKLNAQDGGNRRFILCEMMDYAETITAERIRRVIDGYGEGNKVVAGTGGGFDFFKVGEALFKEDKNLNEEVGAEAIRGYVAYTENIPTEKRWDTENAVSPYALGSTDTALCVFYYEKDRVTTLDIDFLGQLKIKNLPSRPEQFVIYADKCALDKDFLYKHGITFKRIPRDITRF